MTATPSPFRGIPTSASALLLLLLFLLQPAPASAQATGGTDADFVFSPGDRIRISVWPDSSLSGVFPVEASGVVHLPLLGPRAAAGKTVSQFREELRAGYAQDLQLPVVSLEAQFRVSILGAVRAPGVYWVDPSYGVFELISTAGGFGPEAEEERTTITRSGGETYQIDADRLQEAGSAEANLRLRSGDRLVVPQEEGGWDWGIFLQSLTLVVSVATIVTR